MIASDLDAGIHNLLLNCADVQPGESLLIIHEDPKYGWYDLEAPMAVAASARALGLSTKLHKVGAPDVFRDPGIMALAAAHDRVIFFARIGDQDRFETNALKNPSVMSYARNVASLASAYGQTNHLAMLALKGTVNEILATAQQIEITCPRGTRLTGTAATPQGDGSTDVTVKRFPMGVPQPVPCDQFSGQVALTRYLTPTGSKAYAPPNLPIDGTVLAHLDGTRISRFEGDAAQVAAIEAHYTRVASLFGIDPFIVHSWHAGIHPGCTYSPSIDSDPDRWANNTFTHPRLLHFHTCGNYPPGEICWSLLDPSVLVDGVALWQDGVLTPERFAAGCECLRQWPELAQLLASPTMAIGVEQ